MYHRYGRHGPHAWRRWRERRFVRSIVPEAGNAHSTVVYVHLAFANREKVITVTFDAQGILNSVQEATIVNEGYNSVSTQEEKELFLVKAECDGEDLAEQHYRFLGGPPPEDEVRERALGEGKKLALQYVNNMKPIPGNSRTRASEAYMDSFMHAYKSKLVELDLVYPDTEKWRIQKIAQYDKALDSMSLSVEHIAAKSIIQAYEYLKFSSQMNGKIDAMGIDEVIRLAGFYREAYGRPEYAPPSEKEGD
jgi:hypothetical protein